ncbi:MAG: inositol monophosphatase family protein [Deltaproteobacteria bacterium]
MLATGFPYDRRTSPQDNLHAFAEIKKRHAQGIRRCGSAALDLCMVADGTYDGYWEHKLKPWDLAAGAVMVAEGGGRVTSFTGGSVDVLAGELVATNGRIHDELLAALARAEGRGI